MKAFIDFAFSAQGYNHIKTNKVCQDSAMCYSDDLLSVIAVADGHGSDNYPRTDRGSRYAVEIAIGATRDFVTATTNDNIDITLESEAYLEQLAKRILSLWYDAVESDIKASPLVRKELEKVSDKYRQRYLSEKYSEKAYGTTLIVVCITKKCWFALHIGDGKCVTFSDDGTTDEPVPWDENCQSNMTTSICDSDAINEFRYFLDINIPTAVFIGSDGIDDSYANTEELHALYRSILSIFAEHGEKVGAAEVEEFLPKLSKRGSGDDVSIAGIIRSDISPETTALIKAQAEWVSAKMKYEQNEKDYGEAEEKADYIASALKKAKQSFDDIMDKQLAVQAHMEKLAQERVASKAHLDSAEQQLAAARDSLNSVKQTSIIEPKPAEDSTMLDEKNSIETVDASNSDVSIDNNESINNNAETIDAIDVSAHTYPDLSRKDTDIECVIPNKE